MILNIISLSFNSTIEMPQNFFGGGGGAPLCVAPPLLVGEEDFELMTKGYSLHNTNSINSIGL